MGMMGRGETVAVDEILIQKISIAVSRSEGRFTVRYVLSSGGAIWVKPTAQLYLQLIKTF